MIEEYVSVRNSIELLLYEPMNNEIIVKKDGKILHNVEIVSVKPKGLAVLFG
jgi:hypothetical protein